MQTFEGENPKKNCYKNSETVEIVLRLGIRKESSNKLLRNNIKVIIS
jgi:hypothetical protein